MYYIKDIYYKWKKSSPFNTQKEANEHISRSLDKDQWIIIHESNVRTGDHP